MAQNYNILCLDGGGIRGLLTSLLLHDLPPSALANTTVFAGTSTGGILAISLAAGVEMQKLVDLYSTRCGTIFNPALSPAATNDQIKQYLRLFAGPIEADLLLELVEHHHILPINFFAAKYNPSGLRAALSEALGEQASTLVSQLEKKLFITTFQFDRQGSWSPISLDNLDPASNDAMLLDAALCTSAAQGFFPPHKHPTLGYCVDGGVFANNPSTFVLSRVLQVGVDPKTIRMLSLGTGAAVNAVPESYFDTVPPELWGLYQWLFPVKAPPSAGHMPLLTTMSAGSAEIDDEQTASVLGPHYVRAQVPLSQSITLDSCSEVPVLEQLAKDYIAGSDWSNIKQWVEENFV